MQEGTKIHILFFSRFFQSIEVMVMLFCNSSGLSKVYNFNPAFRAENSQTRRHLAEFWMVEAEEAFLSGPEGLQKLMNRIEDLLKASIHCVLDKSEEDVFTHWKQNECTEVSTVS